MKIISPSCLVMAALVVHDPTASADYTIELKNGRRITVQTYREEAGMIKFTGLGGEIGLSKDQVLAIRPANPGDAGSFDIQQAGAVAARPAAVAPVAAA